MLFKKTFFNKKRFFFVSQTDGRLQSATACTKPALKNVMRHKIFWTSKKCFDDQKIQKKIGRPKIFFGRAKKKLDVQKIFWTSKILFESSSLRARDHLSLGTTLIPLQGLIGKASTFFAEFR